MSILLLVVAGVVGIVIVLFLVLSAVGNLLRKVGPNQALIVYGARGTRVVTGGAQFVLPMLQRSREFSLELMSFDVAPRQVLYTTQGVAVNVEAVTQIKVRSDDESIKTAAEQFLSKTQDERENLIRLVMEGHLRGIVGQLTVEDLVKDPESVGAKMLRTVTPDMQKMGLEVISFTIKDVRDENDYITNMGRPETANIRKQADIAEANASREAAIARAAADQERVKAEAESQALQAESQRNLSLKKAAFDAEVKKQQAAADKAYDIQSNVTQQQVVAEAVKVTEVEKQAQVRVQQAEIQRRELELQATIQKAAEAERRRVEIVAEAERQRLILEAQGRADAAKAQGQGDAEATRARGLAEAEIIRARGLAEAEVIRAKGEAEADAMKVKAAAYHEYNQAAVLDKLLTNMPDIVRAIAEPLGKVDKVTIVSTGSDSQNGNHGMGASRVTGDIVNMVAQVPALFELLSGTRLGDLMDRVPALQNDEKNKTDNAHANGVASTAADSNEK